MKVHTWGGDAFATRVTNIARNPTLAADLEYVNNRTHRAGWIQDVYDGQLYQMAQEKLQPGKKAMHWRLTSDPAEFQAVGGSLTPVTLTNMSQSPIVRDRYNLRQYRSLYVYRS